MFLVYLDAYSHASYQQYPCIFSSYWICILHLEDGYEFGLDLSRFFVFNSLHTRTLLYFISCVLFGNFCIQSCHLFDFVTCCNAAEKKRRELHDMNQAVAGLNLAYGGAYGVPPVSILVFLGFINYIPFLQILCMYPWNFVLKVLSYFTLRSSDHLLRFTRLICRQSHRLQNVMHMQT